MKSADISQNYQNREDEKCWCFTKYFESRRWNVLTFCKIHWIRKMKNANVLQNTVNQEDEKCRCFTEYSESRRREALMFYKICTSKKIEANKYKIWLWGSTKATGIRIQANASTDVFMNKHLNIYLFVSLLISLFYFIITSLRRLRVT